MTNEELDKLCAEKVMGWHKIRNGERYEWKVGQDEIYGNPLTIHQEHWRPTINIVQAWECLEQMISLGWIAETSQDVIDYMLIKMWKNEENHPTIAIPISVTAKAPEAIVLACLKAKGVAA